jgi:hypothetical protein
MPWNHEMFMIVERKDIWTIEKKTKIPFFVVIFGSLDIFIWIKAEVEQRFCFLRNPKILQFFLIFRNPKNLNT